MTERDTRTLIDGSEPIGALPADVDLALVGPERYEPGEEIGAGSNGRVVAARDKVAGRIVALKVLGDEHVESPELFARFVHEARVTAALEHPSIIPVHDLGVLPGGTPYYTMRVVERRNLRKLLEESKERDEKSIARLVQLFLVVCRGVAYAHARGVVHRDLKPENVLLGSFGEVYVADWGIAKVLAAPETLPERSSQPPGTAKTLAESGPGLTRTGAVMGTPGYMPPEQIAASAEVDERADIFALGAILYELLTGDAAFGGEGIGVIIQKTLECRPRSPRQLVPGVPLLLEDLCLAMLRPERDDRPQSMEQVVGELEAYIEGARETDRRRAEAHRMASLALAPAAAFRDLGREHQSLVAYAQELAREVKPWEPVEKKRALWQAEDEARAAEIARARALAEAIELYTQSLAYDARSREAHDGLADLYYDKAREAEQQRREAERVFYDSLVTEHDDGRLAARLRADARLIVDVEGHGATVRIARFVEDDRRLVAKYERVLGEGPRAEARVAPGSWLVTVQSEGRADARVPVVCARGEEKKIRVKLFPRSDVPTGFVHVPSGEARIGGDPEAFDPLPAQTVTTADVAFAIHPVTMGEYLAFLDDLVAKGNEAEARQRAPRGGSGTEEGWYVKLEAGRFAPLADFLVEGEGRAYVPDDAVMRLPVVGVTFWDAMAYARWRSKRDGRRFRLPTEIEWERAARGADGRFFPWGDTFDATFCKMRDSRPTISQPEPVGAFAHDESPFGVHDLAGGARQWVLDVHGVLSREASEREPEPAAGAQRADVGMRCTRGGSWWHTVITSRGATRYLYFPTARFSTVGFRIVCDL